MVDEVGCLTYGDDAANVLFHVVNERHIKRRAMVFTTNKHPRSWGPVLHDDDLADAIVDRILHRGRVLKLDGPSLRTKHLATDPVLSETHDNDHPRRVSGTDTSEFLEPPRDQDARMRTLTALLRSPGTMRFHKDRIDVALDFPLAPTAHHRLSDRLIGLDELGLTASDGRAVRFRLAPHPLRNA